ncbi:NADP-dependent oxidoreductase [Natronorarus salvus]|uniref:NADP-dependent oxidoreductase n=1 Tax=Natronorarus salvus TaxID=3117733 RepID=UPI002F26B339
MERTNREWVLASRPEGKPRTEDFELVETEVPEPRAGEVLVRVLVLSVDPYMRGRMRDRDSYAESWDVGEPMQARAVGEVVESAHPEYREGEVVVGPFRWAEYATAPGHEVQPVDPELAPISTALGVLGMPGRTAYFGTLDVAEPKPGDTMVVSAAAGAVGSVVGQIAKLCGARVVGIAGSDRKCDWLTGELGLDEAVNYRESEDMYTAIAEACPDGVDVYYDNVGGEITDAVFHQLNERARVTVCGQIALYNEEGPSTGPRKLWKLIETRARVEGFLISDYERRYEEVTERLAGWISEGELTYEETVSEGIESAPEAFIGLFEGENVGKQVVRVAER